MTAISGPLTTADNNRNESNNRTANTVWTPSKAKMLAKTVKPATAWRQASSSSRESFKYIFVICVSLVMAPVTQ
jgi:hypothetical protein